MIVGAVLEISDSQTGIAERYHNGAALVVFYTMSDAIKWAEIQSELMVYGTNAYGVRTLCSVVNTDTTERRWWFNGVEYTG